MGLVGEPVFLGACQGGVERLFSSVPVAVRENYLDSIEPVPVAVDSSVHDAFLAQRYEERVTLASNPQATDTLALYERWGWHKMGTVPGKPGAYYSVYVRFVLPLPPARVGR